MNWKGIVISLSFIMILIFIIIIALSQNSSAYTSHDPIRIEGDDDFANQAASEGWAGNGTQEDPYIIEGYEIELESGNEPDYHGIYVISTDVHFVIQNIRIVGNEDAIGFNLEDITNATITDCIIENRTTGISLWGSSHIIVTNNTFFNCCFELMVEEDCIISNNNFIKGGLKIFSLEHAGWNSITVDATNIVNGKPIYFLKDNDGGNVPENAGQIILFNCTNFKLEDREFTNTTTGISLFYSYNNTINGNIIKNCTESGINLYYSSENVVSYNQVSEGFCGIFLLHSDNNSILYNRIVSNSLGIDLFHSNSNYVFGNNASENERYGIFCGSHLGHFLNHENSIINNTITNNKINGIEMISCERTYVLGNNIVSNTIGISLTSINYSLFHHNNFINNSVNVIKEDSQNTWRNPLMRGNFWSDYEGLDNTGDGIGDTDLPHLDVDHHPLMEPAKPGDYLEADFIEEPLSETDDTIPCILSVLLILILIIIIVYILKKIQDSIKEKDSDQKNKDE